MGRRCNVGLECGLIKRMEQVEPSMKEATEKLSWLEVQNKLSNESRLWEPFRLCFGHVHFCCITIRSCCQYGCYDP